MYSQSWKEPKEIILPSLLFYRGGSGSGELLKPNYGHGTKWDSNHVSKPLNQCYCHCTSLSSGKAEDTRGRGTAAAVLYIIH